MNTLKTKLKHILYILFPVVLFTSCDVFLAERDYNKRSWEIKKLEIELDYIERLHRIKSDIEFEQQLSKIDSLIKKSRVIK